MSDQTHFTPALFRFLRELGANNNREWFLANKPRYEADVRDPMLRFIAEFGPRLRKLSPHFLADPRPVGGSMFRIYRDVRFSKDKRPYKTTASAFFHHVMSHEKDIATPGFYLHLAPGEVFIGSGVWHPDGQSLAKIRNAIVAHPERWKRGISDREFRQTCRLSGAKLKRPPNGYDPGHPLIEDLKRKDFVTVTDLSERDACSPRFMSTFSGACEAAVPFMRFLTQALELKW